MPNQIGVVVYAHVLGQTTAVLIPLATLIATDFLRNTLAFSAYQVRAFTGPSIPILSSDVLVLLTRPFDRDVLVDGDGGGFASGDAVGTGGMDSAGKV